jgi:hypothetical protein
MTKSPTRFRVSTSNMDDVKTKFEAAAPGSIVHVQFGTKTLEIVKEVEGAAVAVATVAAAEEAPTRSVETCNHGLRGTNLKDAQANKLITAMYDSYKKLKMEFCAERATNTGVKQEDVLLGNQTLTFMRFRKDYVDKTQLLKDTYYAEKPPTTFDAEAEAWLWAYWQRVVTYRAPRDRTAERAALKRKKEGVAGAEDLMSE